MNGMESKVLKGKYDNECKERKEMKGSKVMKGRKVR